jgi:hypothetical protein
MRHHEIPNSKFQLALRSLDWPKPLTKQFSQTEIINRLAGPYLLSLDSVGVSPSTQMFSSPPTPLLSPSSGLRIRSAASSPPVTGSVGGETGVTAASPAPRSSVEQRLIEMARQFLHLIDAYKLESSWTVADDKAVASKAVQRIISFMIEPIRQRLAFHFEGNRPTNRLDKVRVFLIIGIIYFNSQSPSGFFHIHWPY